MTETGSGMVLPSVGRREKISEKRTAEARNSNHKMTPLTQVGVMGIRTRVIEMNMERMGQPGGRTEDGASLDVG